MPLHPDRITPPTTAAVGSLREPYLQRQTGRALARMNARAVLRVADVEAEGIVQTAKVHELDHLGREAMSGQAMLRQWGAILAAGDPFVADELKFFSDIVRMGKGEVIADTIATYCRESRR